MTLYDWVQHARDAIAADIGTRDGLYVSISREERVDTFGDQPTFSNSTYRGYASLHDGSRLVWTAVVEGDTAADAALSLFKAAAKEALVNA